MAGGYNVICLPGLKLIEEVVFKTSGTYNIPPGAKLIQFFLVSAGGGGGGGGGGLEGGYGGGGGGGGGAGGALMGYIYITGTLTSIGVIVGSGGSGGAGGAPGVDGSPGGYGGHSYLRVDGRDAGVMHAGGGGAGGKAGTSTAGGAGGAGGKKGYLISFWYVGRTANTWTWFTTRSPFGPPVLPDPGSNGASGSANGGYGGSGGGVKADYSPLGQIAIYILDGRSIGGGGGAGGVGSAGGDGRLPEGYGSGGGGGGGGAPGYSGGNGGNGAPGIVIIRAYALNKDIIPGMDFVGVV